MKLRYFSRIWVLGTVAIFLFNGCDPIPSKVLTPDQKEADMKWLYSQFDENYAPLEYKMNRLGFNYQSMKEAYLKEAVATTTNTDFYLTMHRFIAQFQDPHTTAALNVGGLPHRAQIAYLGFTGKRSGNDFVVTEIFPTFDLSKSNFPVKKGDVIHKMDGKLLPLAVNEEMIQYEDIGNGESNLTFHYNRLFTRLSTDIPLPAQSTATLEIITRKSDTSEKKEISVTIPWIVKDIYEFKSEQKVAKGASGSMEQESLVGNPLLLGLRGFDGSLKMASSFFEKAFQSQGNFGYLETFYFPNQIESWTAKMKKDVLPLAQLKSERHIPVDARFITKSDATFPTYLTSEEIRSPDGRKIFGNKLIATLYLNTFSPKAHEKDVIEEFKQTLRDLNFYGVNDLVIDLINNGGGSISLGMKLAQALSNQKIEMPWVQLRLSGTWLDQFESISLTAPSDSEKELGRRVYAQLKDEEAQKKRLSSPISSEALVPFQLIPNSDLNKRLNIVLMVNEMCASMCDIFSAIMQDNAMAVVLGSQTMGAGGNVVPHYQAPNSHLIIRQTESLILRSNPERSYIENNGVKPDFPFNVSKDSVRKFRSVRKAALNLLTIQREKRKRSERR